MFVYTEYILLCFSIMILSVYFGTYAHSFPQESLVRDSAAQTTDGDLIVQASGSTTSASLLLGVCDLMGSLTRIMGTLHTNLSTIMIVSHQILLRMRNVAH
jgi:hypothetical protein